LDCSQEAAPPVTPGPATLLAIDNHFWDWIWWIATKSSIGRDDLVAEHLRQLHEHLLRPMGVEAAPENIEGAIDGFLMRRNKLERAYDLPVPRALETEVRNGIRRILKPGA
jgi:hypothetical protein